jgi:stage V sporulation protein G
MEITDVQIYLMHEEKLKAYATVILDNAFLIRDLKVIEGNNGLFIAMPAKKMKDGSYRDIAHPLNQETRVYFETKVLEAYDVAASKELSKESEVSLSLKDPSSDSDGSNNP